MGGADAFGMIPGHAGRPLEPGLRSVCYGRGGRSRPPAHPGTCPLSLMCLLLSNDLLIRPAGTTPCGTTCTTRLMPTARLAPGGRCAARRSTRSVAPWKRKKGIKEIERKSRGSLSAWPARWAGSARACAASALLCSLQARPPARVPRSASTAAAVASSVGAHPGACRSCPPRSPGCAGGGCAWTRRRWWRAARRAQRRWRSSCRPCTAGGPAAPAVVAASSALGAQPLLPCPCLRASRIARAPGMAAPSPTRPCCCAACAILPSQVRHGHSPVPGSGGSVRSAGLPAGGPLLQPPLVAAHAAAAIRGGQPGRWARRGLGRCQAGAVAEALAEDSAALRGAHAFFQA